MYLIFYVFIVQKKYLQIDVPVGAIRLNSMGPCQPFKDSGLCKTSSKKNPVKAVGETCERNFQCNLHEYCAQPGDNTSSLAYGKQPCTFPDHNTVTWPPSEQGALTLATRMSIYNQKLEKGTTGQHCGPVGNSLPQTEYDCQWQPSLVSGHSLDAYVADVGNFTVSLNHAVAATTLPITKTGMELKGELMRCNHGKKCTYDDIDHFSTVKSFIPDKDNHGNARFTVEQILNAVVPEDHEGKPADQAGIDLDAMNTGCPAKCVQYSTGKHLKQSNRWTGFVVLLDLQYDNTGLLIKDSSENDVRYRLRSYVMKDSAFRVEVPFVQKNNSRVIHHLHGIRFVAMVKGNLGQPSFNVVLVQLTTSITMIFLSTTIVDLVITRCMVDREYFKAIKFEDDKNALTDDKLKQLGVSRERKEGIDWKAVFTLGFMSSNDKKEPTEDTQPLVGGAAKPAQGSGAGTGYSGPIDTETTPLFQQDTEQDTPSGTMQPRRGMGCCRPGKELPA